MRGKVLLLVAVSQFAFTGAALAQTAPAGNDEVTGPDEAATTGDNQIVVTARRREEVLQDVPISITALGGDALTARGITDALDLQGSVPSLAVTTTGASRASVAYSIRGQRTNETQLLTDPPVGLYFAEVVVPRAFGFGAAFYDLQNIQVLKGVQGTLFGRNMTGGAVLVEPAHPNLSEFSGSARVQYGNYDLVDIEGMLNLPVVADTLGVRFAGKYRNRDGFTTDVSTGRDFDDENYYALRGSIELDTGNFRNYLVADFIEQNVNGTGLKLTAVAAADPVNGQPTIIARQAGASPFFPVAAGAPPQDVFALAASALALPERQVDFGNFGSGPLYANRVAQQGQFIQNWGITNRTELDIGDITLRNIFGYRETEYENINDFDGFGAALIQPFQFASPRHVSEEFQILGSQIAPGLDLTLGAFYFREWGDDGSINANFPQLTSIGFASNPPGNPLAGFFLTQPAQFYELSTVAHGVAESWAIYAAGTLDLTDTLSLAAGIRYNDDSREVTVNPFYTTLSIPVAPGVTLDQPCAFNGLGTLTRAECPQTRTRSDSAVTYDVTLQFEPNPDLTAYAAVRRGYRAGGFSLRATTDATLQSFAPEFVQEYEIGLKNSFGLGGADLSTSIAIFYQDYTNVQKQNALLVDGQVATVVTNTAAQENYGGELEVNLAFDIGLSLNTHYSYVGINVTDGGNGTIENTGVPKHQLGFGATYSRSLDFGDLSINVNGNYQSEVPLDEFDVIAAQDGYFLANARISVDNITGSGLGLAVFARNIFDKYYAIGTLSLLSNGPVLDGVNPGGGVGFSANTYGEPRMYGVEASFKF